MTNENLKSSDDVSKNEPFPDTLNPIIRDLLYPSESDELIQIVTCTLSQEAPLTGSQIKDWLLLSPSVSVDEIPVADFWEPVITEQDWYETEEKARTAKFQQVKKILEQQLTGCQVFRVGEIEMDVYLLGRKSDGERAGLKTKIVQT